MTLPAPDDSNIAAFCQLCCDATLLIIGAENRMSRKIRKYFCIAPLREIGATFLIRQNGGMTRTTLDSFLQRRGSLDDRLNAGKAERQNVPRSAWADFRIRTRRSIPIETLRAQATNRAPDLVPVRHARMAENPFAFFRGGAATMASDLSTLPSPHINVQLCGDMHVSNFGFFSTTERRLVFGINDFDETLPGHFDWDLKRLTASTMIAAQHLGKDRRYGGDLIRTMMRAYRRRIMQYAGMPYVELARCFIDETALLAEENRIAPSARRIVEKQIAKARKNTNIGAIGKLTIDTPEGRRLIENPPLIMHRERTRHGFIVRDILDDGLKSYARSLLSDRRHVLLRYQLIDFARKVVGVGSVGTGCWVLYLEGLDIDDPLFLQHKEAQASVLAPYFPTRRFKTQGERVVHGQRLIQGAPDIFLGYGTTRENQFYVRQLRDMKGGIAIGENGIGADEFSDYARLFGWALANAHARSGDPAVLAGYCGQGEQLDEALVRFAENYCEQNEADYDTFLKAVRSGKLPASTENL